MTSSAPIIPSAASPPECHRCGYDLRAAAPQGRCPECGASVAEALRLAGIPRRPAWRDSDPRWRRRILVGLWVLTATPWSKLLLNSDWATGVRIPATLMIGGSVTLNDTFLNWDAECLFFCIGVVLLFARERGRRPHRLDWSRRWGVVASYGVLILGFVNLVFITALVCIGVAAVFLSMPLHYQPQQWVTNLIMDIGVGIVRFGIHPSWITDASLPTFSAAAVLLACVPLYNAIRATGAKAPAVVLLAPLVIGCLVQFMDVVLAATVMIRGYGRPEFSDFYFNAATIQSIASLYDPFHLLSLVVRFRILLEFGKWLALVAVALWLSGAQVLAHRGGRRREREFVEQTSI